MLIKGAKYVCDRCGKEVFVEQIRKEIKEEPGSFMVATPRPSGWEWYSDYSKLLCDECTELVNEN